MRGVPKVQACRNNMDELIARKVEEASERNAVDRDVSAGERDGYAACVSPNMDIS